MHIGQCQADLLFGSVKLGTKCNPSGVRKYLFLELSVGSTVYIFTYSQKLGILIINTFRQLLLK